MRNKKLITLLVCLAMSVASVGMLSACNNTEESSSENSTPAASSPADSVADSSVEGSSVEDSSIVDSSVEDSSVEDSSVEDSSTEDSSTPEVQNFTVTFDAANGEAVTTATVEQGKAATKPADPVKQYYVFGGWYNGDVEWDFDADKVTANVTLTAKWTAKEYVVKYYANNTLVEEKTYTCENIASFEAPAVPSVPNFENGRWDMAPEAYLIYSEDAIIVTAEYDRCQYTVTFVNEDETSTVSASGGLTVAAPTDPTKDKYVFDGWYNGDTKWNFDTDTVSSELTLTAKFVARVYTVIFVDFDGNETEVTYTVENAADFALPAVPAAPANSENPRWDKTAEECLIYSEETLYVYADSDYAKYTVTFVGADIAPEEVEWNSTITSAAPVRDGFVFAGWTLNGEAFDVNTPITEDIELVATWNAVSVDMSDYVLSAQDVYDGAQLEEGYGYKEKGASANPNASWYFDSDYNGNTGANGTVENQFANITKFTLTVDGGDGTLAEGRETYIILPAIDYTLTKKVDFAYYKPGNVSSIKIYGTEVHNFDGTNKLISIVTDENGTKLYFREINSVTGDVTAGAQAVIDIPESVANGSEGLKLNVTVTGWMEFTITEFHVTGHTVHSIDEYETTLCNAVVNAAAGSVEQFDAIYAYRAFSNTLNAEEKASEAHVANVETINAIIEEYFYASVTEEILLNDPTVDTSRGAVDQNERIQTGWGAHNTDYNTTYETYVHMIQYASGDFDGTITLPAMNYNAYVEAYFGLRAITADGTGTITIGDGSYSFDNSKNHNWKVTIKGNLLTVSDDNTSNNDGGGVLWTTVLSDEVASGAAGLVIDCSFEAWTQVEVTEMHVVEKPNRETVYDNAVTMEMSGTTVGNALSYHESTYWGSGAHTAFNTSYTSQNLVSFNAADAAYTAVFTMPNFDFTKYDETYFGFTAATAAGDATVTINSTSYSYDEYAGYVYVKMIVKDGVLTVVGDGASNAGTVYMTVELTEGQMNGTEAIVLEWSTAGWAQVEITEMHAVKVLNKVN